MANVFDGTSQARTALGKANKLPMGTYFYFFEYFDVSGGTIKLSGHLYLN